MGCCPVHQLLNKANLIFIFTGFWFLTSCSHTFSEHQPFARHYSRCWRSTNDKDGEAPGRPPLPGALTFLEKFGALGRLQPFEVFIKHRKEFGVYSNQNVKPGSNSNNKYFNSSPWVALCGDSQKPPELLLLLFGLLSIINILGLSHLHIWRQKSCQPNSNNFKPLEGIVYKRTPTEQGLVCSRSLFPPDNF